MTNNEKRIEILFDELVPSKGKCDSVAGEMVRAVSRIVYRFWNDGDKIGVDYGNETCNAPARYLKNYGNAEVSTLINDMWGMYNDDIYETCCDKLCGLVADQIENDSSLREKETEDMFDYFRRDDYDYYDYYEDEEEDYYEDEEED